MPYYAAKKWVSGIETYYKELTNAVSGKSSGGAKANASKLMGN